ncbi:urease accessory protein UreH domain-containing protein [Petrimonas sp.]|uniref:urease accessory protein UreH domain-containing protein n=1 Tax=Petrimonas sp. TaxID=2023866 RepID=UPI002FC7AD89
MKQNNFITKTLKIDGMTCINCENRIERALKAINGIISVKVNFSKGIAIVTFDASLIRLEEIEKTIEKLDYIIIGSGGVTSNKTNGLQVVGVIVIILAIYMIMNRFGGFSIFNSFPEAKAGMGYGILFVIGLLTSIHCVAMCGGINLSQCAQYKGPNLLKENKLSNLRPSLQYNAGRVISYTIIGGIVGAVGSVVSFSGTGKGIVAIVAGVFMVIMGLNMLNIFPWLRKFNPRMPKIFATKINKQKDNNKPLYVGLLNGLMPCGPLQAMQLYALSTGDPIKGALSMLLFSLGTVPLMFGLGALSTLLTKKFQSRMMTVSAGLVVILGIFMFSNGMALSGFAVPLTSNALTNPGSSASSSTAEVIDGVQVVTTTLASGGYEPIKVQAGIPVQWNIQAETSSINGCNNRIIIPEYNIEKKLEPGDNYIEFTPEESGTVPFSCWMGMIRSQISVYENLEDQSQVLPQADTSQLPSCCD